VLHTFSVCTLLILILFCNCVYLQVFFGNNDTSSVVCNTFNRFVVAQRARLYPLSWNYIVALRMEYLGCKLGEISQVFLIIRAVFIWPWKNRQTKTCRKPQTHYFLFFVLIYYYKLDGLFSFMVIDLWKRL